MHNYFLNFPISIRPSTPRRHCALNEMNNNITFFFSRVTAVEVSASLSFARICLCTESFPLGRRVSFWAFLLPKLNNKVVQRSSSARGIRMNDNFVFFARNFISFVSNVKLRLFKYLILNFLLGRKKMEMKKKI